MKTLYTSDLNVLFQLYAPEDYVLQVFDPFDRLHEDEKLNCYHGEGKRKILVNLGDDFSMYRGQQAEDFEVIFNWGNPMKKVFPFERRFSFIQDPEKRVRWYFPQGKIAHCLAFYNNSGWRGRMIANAIQFAQRLGLSALLSSGKLEILSTEPLKIDALNDLATSNTYSVFTGARSKMRSAVLALYKNNCVQEYIKVATTPISFQVMSREKNVMRKLSAGGFASFSLSADTSSHPGLMRCKNLGLQGGKKTSKFTNEHVQTLIELAKHKQHVSALESSKFWEKAIENINHIKRSSNPLMKHLHRELKSLSELMNGEGLILTSAAHGDFVPWNILHSKKGLALYDWELFDEKAPALYDLFHFIYQRGILMNQLDASSIQEELNRSIQTHPELQSYVDQFHLDIEKYHRLYLLKCASYFGAMYADEKLTIQHKWQIETWTKAIHILSQSMEKAAERSTFILRFNSMLQAIPHAYMKFNFDSLSEVPLSSDLDIAIPTDHRNQILEFCKNQAKAKIQVHKKSFMTTVELYFENHEFLSIDLIHDFKRKGMRFMDIQSVLSESKIKQHQLRLPQVKHDMEYAFLFYTLNGAVIPEKYKHFFHRQDAWENRRAIAYLNVKYGFQFNHVNDLFKCNLKSAKRQLLVHVKVKNDWIEQVKLNAHYYIDTLKSAWTRSGFIISFSGVDGAGKSTVIQMVQDELANKYRKEVVLLRHRPGLLPMLNAYRVGKEKAEQQASVNLPRQGSNSGQISSALRFAYYYADYLLGQMVIYFRYLMRGKLVIFDRYYFDFIIDPKRSNIEVNSKLTKLLYALILKPKLNFFLYAKPEVIHARKQELEPEVIRELSSNYMNLFQEFGSKSKQSKYVPVENEELAQTMHTVFSEFQQVA